MDPNETMLKFKYPDTLLKEYQHWVVLLRPNQPTIGSLVLACTSKAESMSELSIHAFNELSAVTKEIEYALKRAFQYDKINYMALMMVDKQVHFHVIPRYAEDRSFEDLVFSDKGWPALPKLTETTELSDDEFEILYNYLQKHFN
ncbi:MAG: HIT family protein [Candidatus Heimdallarchaeota archaeon]|nr:HIT family protein [Candidatus Heimdallarchaeota archaeon]